MTVDHGFAAGIIDARGHIELVGRHGAQTPRIRVTTARVELLTWLANRTGTAVHRDARGYERRACAEHCGSTHVHIARQSSYWNVDAARAVIVLYNVLPYLVCQLSVAHEALLIGTLTWPVSPRTEISEQMRRRGWDIPDRADLPRPGSDTRRNRAPVVDEAGLVC